MTSGRINPERGLSMGESGGGEVVRLRSASLRGHAAAIKHTVIGVKKRRGKVKKYVQPKMVTATKQKASTHLSATHGRQSFCRKAGQLPC